MLPLRKTLLACVLLLWGNLYLQAQVNEDFALCNFFYVTSDNPEVLPFADDCFIQENIVLKDLRMIREKGPISEQIDLFRTYPWSFRIYLPEIDHEQRIYIQTPTALLARDLEMQPGEFFMTISDNRERKMVGKNTDEVDFAAVSGKARITEYLEPESPGAHPEFNVQLDVKVQKVIRTPSGSARLEGEPVRIKGVLKIENK